VKCVRCEKTDMGKERWRFWCWEFVSLSGDGVFWFILLPAVSYMRGEVKAMNELLTSTVSVCLAADLATIATLKMLVKRKRPPHHKTDSRFVGPDKHSFPSGHATRTWALARILLPHYNVLYLSGWASLVGLSRISLGRHYVSDVIAGGLIGWFGIAAAATSIHHRLFSS